MAIVPADKSRRPDHARQVIARHAERLVQRRAGCEDDGIITFQQFANGNIGSHRNIADKPHRFAQRDAFITACDPFDRLMVWGNAAADQTIGYRQTIDDIDARCVAERLLTAFCAIIACGAGADDRDVAHWGSPVRRILARGSAAARCVGPSAGADDDDRDTNETNVMLASRLGHAKGPMRS
ncbi:hypothetical protein D9M73_123020 [compost metagenome]